MVTSFKNRVFCLLTVSLLCTRTWAQCMMVEVPLSERIEGSTIIVEGKVVSKKSFWDKAQTTIYTANLVEVYKVFKGKINDSLIEILTLGGMVGERAMAATPSLQLSLYQKGIFFLEPSSVEKNELIYKKESYYPFADAQGFLSYNDTDGSGSDVFKVYKNIEKNVYRVIEKRLKQDYKIVGSDNKNTRTGYIPQVAPSISSFSPASITAGTKSVLTINGSGFGSTQGSSYVSFINANNQTATYFNATATQHYLSWSDTKIEVYVPGDIYSGTAGVAGTGKIKVTVGSSSATSATAVTIPYAVGNIVYGSQNNVIDLGDPAGNGGYAFSFNTGFNSNAPAVAAFTRALEKWRCTTLVNLSMDPNTTTINTNVLDQVNVVTFSSALPSGTLARTTSQIGGCQDPNTSEWQMIVTEMDLLISSSFNWYYGTGTPSASQYDFESDVTHELGHVHQLLHVLNSAALMYPGISTGQISRTIDSDDLNGANYIMNLSTAANTCWYPAMIALTPSTCGITGTQELDGAGNMLFSAYPNPVSNELFLSFDKYVQITTAKVSIINMLSQTVLKKTFYQLNEKIVRLDMSGLGKGMYLVNVTIDSEKQNTLRIIVF